MAGTERRPLILERRQLTERASQLADHAGCDLAGIWLPQALEALGAELGLED